MSSFAAGFGTIKLGLDTISLAKGSQSATNVLRQVELAAFNLNKALTKNESAVKRLGNAFKISFITMSASIAVCVKEFADFELSMARVNALMRPTGAVFRDLIGLTKKLGETTFYSSQEIAEAMGTLVQAGYEAQDIKNMLPTLLKVATLEQIDLERATRIATDTLAAFQMGTEDTVEVCDLLAVAANKSKLTMVELGQSMKNIGPMAYQMKVPLDEVLTSLMVASQQGMRGAFAGTALGRMLTKIGQRDTKGWKIAQRIGFDPSDKKTGGLKPLDQIIDEFNRATKHLGPIGKTQIIQSMTGEFGRRVFAPLVSGGGDEFRRYKSMLSNAQGYLGSASGILDNTFKGSIIRLKNTILNTLIEIGEGFATYLKPIIDQYITPMIVKIREWAVAHLPIIIQFSKLMGLVAGLGSVFGILLPSILSLIGAMSSFALIGGAVVVALSAIGAALIETYGTGDTFREKFLNVLAVLPEKFEQLKIKIQDIAQNFPTYWDSWVESFKSLAVRIGVAIETQLDVVIEKVKVKWKEISNTIKSDPTFQAIMEVVKAPQKVKEWASDAWKGTKETVKNLPYAAGEVGVEIVNTVARAPWQALDWLGNKAHGGVDRAIRWAMPWASKEPDQVLQDIVNDMSKMEMWGPAKPDSNIFKFDWEGTKKEWKDFFAGKNSMFSWAYEAADRLKDWKQPLGKGSTYKKTGIHNVSTAMTWEEIIGAQGVGPVGPLADVGPPSSTTPTSSNVPAAVSKAGRKMWEGYNKWVTKLIGTSITTFSDEQKALLGAKAGVPEMVAKGLQKPVPFQGGTEFLDQMTPNKTLQMMSLTEGLQRLEAAQLGMNKQDELIGYVKRSAEANEEVARKLNPNGGGMD